ncbi:MAG: hypothetical protein U1F41_15820 [Burkholderiales bacterium]
MKPLLAVLLLGVSLIASAQATTAGPDSAPSTHAANDTPSSRDPRACLEFPTREQVIACAEKFRPHRAPRKS